MGAEARMWKWKRTGLMTWTMQLGMFSVIVCYDCLHGGGYVIRGSFGKNTCQADGKEVHYKDELTAKRDAEIIAQDALWAALEPFGVVRP